MKNALLALLGLVFLLSAGPVQDTGWSKETTERFATLPVQDGGRIKPMDKLAGLNLLTFNGKRKLELPDGRKIGSTEWLLDCLFFPEKAKDYQCFRVQNDAVITAIGIDVSASDKRKSDRYSFNELAGARAQVEQKASQAAGVEPSDRNPTQRQTLKLATDLRKFEKLLGTTEPLRWTFDTSGSPELIEMFGGESTTLSGLLAHSSELAAIANSLQDENSAEYTGMQKLFGQLDSVMDVAFSSIAFMPPAAGSEDELVWWSVSDLVMASFQSNLDTTKQQELLSNFEALERSKNDPAAFASALEALHGNAVAMAEARGEYNKIPLEVRLERMDPFTNALVLYLLGFLLLAIGWLLPGNKWLPRVALISILIALGLAITGITMRCIIRSRPPVVSLYDTVLFITTVCVLVGLVAEWLTRTRVALGVAGVLGVAGMFLAGRYELKEIASSGDTMASVVAVLDTNYYLAIHVTTISMGYAGGLLAAGLAHVWILGKLFRIRRNDKKFYKSIIRMTYGVLCFSLLFAIFGTIMGGVWANDSWGRFWGWDPKENGALLICLWELLILHARMGGYIKDRGFAVMVVLGGVVVSASWWGVNLLGVGLHSYGFTSGVVLALLGYWVVELLVVSLSALDAFMRKADAKGA